MYFIQKYSTIDQNKKRSSVFYQANWFALLLIFTFSFSINSQAQEYLRVYTSAPLVMVSDVTGGTLITENFESFTVPPQQFNWAPQPGGYSSSVGNYYQTAGQSYVKLDDQYGAGTGKYMSIRVGGKVRLVFDNPVEYFGFAWPAGDGQNNIKIYRDGQIIGTFATADVIALLPNTNHLITAVNGTQYTTNSYYGKPGTGQNSGEPYAFLHFVATEGLAFDEIEFAMGAGGEFENDNHTLLINGDAEVQGTWVELITIQTPTANDDSDSGLPGDAVTIDVLDNDTPGDSPINPASVQIAGTNGPGESLTVTGEGVWSINTTNGFITFTPDPAFTGSPTPIQYFVRDNAGYASNLATVTITYPVGPTANNDNAITEKNVPVDIDVLNNDTQGTSAIDPTSVTFVAGTEPNPATEGVFTVNAITGLVTFTPANDFTGTVTIDYQVCDVNNLCDIATITVDVVAGTSNLYPATGFGTLAFEDLWPGKGDYDFNDLILDYQFEITTNTSNFVEHVKGTFVIKAFGASYENGFGFQLASGIDPDDLTVTGSQLKENIITLSNNGTEAGQTIPTIIVFDNAYKEMQHPGMGVGVNTEPTAPYVTPVTIEINIDFTPNTYTYNDLNIGQFNPFIFVNKVRSVEVHLPDYPPTALADQSLFGTMEDDSNPADGRYYKTANNLPWAINLYESFDYPIEKQQIVWAYLKFAAWAASGGTTFQDWYQDLTGYRDNSLIYYPPIE
ncbi:MAG: LruC domain-containing protein [Bacteroidales bacterium]|nr:LruC domain-containing protein [Bacteroidales bacterium]